MFEILPFKYKKIKDKCYSASIEAIEHTDLFKDYSIIGNGYDIEKIFMLFLDENEFDIKTIITDSESEMFIVYCENKELLIDIILKFKNYMDNTDNLSNAIRKIDFEN